VFKIVRGKRRFGMVNLVPIFVLTSVVLVQDDVEEKGIVESSDLISALIGVVAGALLAYYLGKRQGRAQTQYARSVEAATKIRGDIHDLAKCFTTLYEPPYGELEGRERRRETHSKIGPKLGALASDFNYEKIWLQPELRRAVESILSIFTTRYETATQKFKEMGIFGRTEIEQTHFANGYERWIKGKGPEGLQGQLSNFEKTLEKVLGTPPL
jgi:ABC-type cobalt transport system substrate-binding protein